MRKQRPKTITKRGDGKDQYRKKAYNPPAQKIVKSVFTRKVLSILARCNKQECNKVCKILHETGSRGAKLEVLMGTLHQQDIYNIIPNRSRNKAFLISEIYKHAFPDDLLMVLAATAENDLVGERIRYVDAWKKKRRSIKAAASQICNLPPLREELLTEDLARNFNREFSDMKRSLQNLTDIYLDYVELSMFNEMPVKDFRGSLDVEKAFHFNEKIVAIVSELIQVGYADKTAYTLTSRLMKASYPNYFTASPEAVRQRYTYHK